MRRWIDPLLAARGVDDAGVTAGVQMPVLWKLCAMENRVVRLARGEYDVGGDVQDLAHLRNEPLGEEPDYDERKRTRPGRSGYRSGAMATGRCRSRRVSRWSGRRASCFQATSTLS